MTAPAPELGALPGGLGGVLVLPRSAYRRDRRPWLAARRTGLGASETSAILGLNPWKTALQVWADKVDTAPPEDVHASDAAEWGNVLEAPVARETVKRWPHLGKLVPTPGLLRHPDHPWMLATLDFLLAPRGRREVDRIDSALEVKTTSAGNYHRNWIGGVPPAAIQVQVQQQLAVTGLDHIWVTVWLRDTAQLPEPVRIDRSEAVIDQLIRYGGMWWRDHVEGRERPEPTFADHADLARYFPGDPSLDAVTADVDLLDKVARHRDAKRRLAEVAEEVDQLAFDLKRAMGDRTAIATPSGDVVTTWRPQRQTGFDRRRFAADHPDLAAEYTTQKPIRVLRHRED